MHEEWPVETPAIGETARHPVYGTTEIDQRPVDPCTIASSDLFSYHACTPCWNRQAKTEPARFDSRSNTRQLVR